MSKRFLYLDPDQDFEAQNITKKLKLSLISFFQFETVTKASVPGKKSENVGKKASLIRFLN